MNQFEVGSWGERTFPQATNTSIVAHLRREVEELAAEVERGVSTRDLAYEAADVYLLLLHLAHRGGFDLATFAARKHAINERRAWGQPDAEGVVEHTRGDKEEDDERDQPEPGG